MNQTNLLADLNGGAAGAAGNALAPGGGDAFLAAADATSGAVGVTVTAGTTIAGGDYQVQVNRPAYLDLTAVTNTVNWTDI
jgi:hypothetical protein